jgi:glycosyltransferase involved in cell wall biosynthesis
MKLSVVIPVYNERQTISEVMACVRRLPGLAASGGPVDAREIMIVDDGSTDGTREYLRSLPEDRHTRIVFHERNRGKGAAVRTGLQHISGDIILIQDADLEYDPADYPRLLAPILAGQAQVVYGSRLLAGFPAGMSFSHRLGNRLLTWAANALYGSSLTDLETCYKVFTREVAERLDLRSARWGFDPEITAQILRLGCTIHEVPICYRGRTAAAGKKIGWRHALSILGTLLRCRLGGPPPAPFSGRMAKQDPAGGPKNKEQRDSKQNRETFAAQVRL